MSQPTTFLLLRLFAFILTYNVVHEATWDMKILIASLKFAPGGEFSMKLTSNF